jgi:hypothetical protein
MAKPLEKMTIRELRQYARDVGLSTVTRLERKAQLLHAIRLMQQRHPGQYILPEQSEST